MNRMDSGSPPPPPPQSSPVNILRVPASGILCVRFLGPIRGLLTHRQGGHSVPCLGPARCPSGLHRGRSVWKGYSPAEGWDAATGLWRPAVLEITERLEEVLRGRPLRGEVWTLARESTGERNAAVYGVFAERVDASALRPPFDVLPVLKRFFHEDDFPFDLPNPLPGRLMLEPSSDPPPRLPEQIQPAAAAEPSPEQVEHFRDQLKKALRGNTPRPSANGRGSDH